MPVVRITDLADPRVADYRNVPDPVLLRDRNLFAAEGRFVVRMLLERGQPRLRSLLVTEAALDTFGDRPAVAGVPVYVCPRTAMSELVGFDMTRGCVALGERPAPAQIGDVLPDGAGPCLVVVLEAAANADNVGGVFRNAAAFGADAVLLGPTCCDPLYRKAIRVSIGSTLRVPFAYLPEWPRELDLLRDGGFQVAALTPDGSADDVGRVAEQVPLRLAIVAGAEGAGLSDAAIAATDLRIRIPMAPGVDSLNLATAVGIALHRLSRAVR
jgi:tRNA G18 (ribose-2'-O)-methylase SpoU